MGMGKRLLAFGGGGLLGVGIGTAVAVLLAPRSGDEQQGRLSDLIRQARLNGTEAKAAKEAELIEKYRVEVNDPDALSEEVIRTRAEAERAIADQRMETALG
ncbi:MAG TPA: hypothetical protein VGR16_00655 [Thermomicrobiales bacterium]|nr:hypothetical protein [Thermomicrobiales bacterium]